MSGAAPTAQARLARRCAEARELLRDARRAARSPASFQHAASGHEQHIDALLASGAFSPDSAAAADVVQQLLLLLADGLRLVAQAPAARLPAGVVAAAAALCVTTGRAIGAHLLAATEPAAYEALLGAHAWADAAEAALSVLRLPSSAAHDGPATRAALGAAGMVIGAAALGALPEVFTADSVLELAASWLALCVRHLVADAAAAAGARGADAPGAAAEASTAPAHSRVLQLLGLAHWDAAAGAAPQTLVALVESPSLLQSLSSLSCSLRNVLYARQPLPAAPQLQTLALVPQRLALPLQLLLLQVLGLPQLLSAAPGSHHVVNLLHSTLSTMFLNQRTAVHGGVDSWQLPAAQLQALDSDYVAPLLAGPTGRRVLAWVRASTGERGEDDDEEEAGYPFYASRPDGTLRLLSTAEKAREAAGWLGLLLLELFCWLKTELVVAVNTHDLGAMRVLVHSWSSNPLRASRVLQAGVRAASQHTQWDELCGRSYVGATAIANTITMACTTEPPLGYGRLTADAAGVKLAPQLCNLLVSLLKLAAADRVNSSSYLFWKAVTLLSSCSMALVTLARPDEDASSENSEGAQQPSGSGSGSGSSAGPSNPAAAAQLRRLWLGLAGRLLFAGGRLLQAAPQCIAESGTPIAGDGRQPTLSPAGQLYHGMGLLDVLRSVARVVGGQLAAEAAAGEAAAGDAAAGDAAAGVGAMRLSAVPAPTLAALQQQSAVLQLQLSQAVEACPMAMPFGRGAANSTASEQRGVATFRRVCASSQPAAGLEALGGAVCAACPSPHSCNLPQCSQLCGLSERSGSVCSACKAAMYCSRPHQVSHWGSHKAVCRLLRQQLVAAAGATTATQGGGGSSSTA